MDGRTGRYDESSVTNPVNVYGKSKEMGEKFLATPHSSQYGIPSVLGQYYYDIVPIKVIPPQVFYFQ